MAVDNGVRRVERSEMMLQLKDEDVLIAKMAAVLMAANPNMSIPRCVENSYSLLDETIKQRESRLLLAMDK